MVAQAFGRTEMPFTVCSGFISCRDLGPTRIRLKTRPETRRQLLEAGNHRIDATAADISQRPPAERRESGAEYHGGVQQVRILNNMLAQTGGAFVHQHQDQSVNQIGRGAARGGRLFGLSDLPEVETGAAFAAKLFRSQQFL